MSSDRGMSGRPSPSIVPSEPNCPAPGKLVELIVAAAAEAPSACTGGLHLVSGSEQIGQLGATDAVCLIRSEGAPNEPYRAAWPSSGQGVGGEAPPLKGRRPGQRQEHLHAYPLPPRWPPLDLLGQRCTMRFGERAPEVMIAVGWQGA